MQHKTHDLIVVGAGPAGMMAALVAARAGKQVLLLEKNPELGRKLAITGGGRCNILNAEPDTKVLLAQYGPAAKFLHSPFAQFGMEATWDFFHTDGLPLTVEDRQRAFPASKSAPDVVAWFTEQLAAASVELRTDCTVTAIHTSEGSVTSLETTVGRYTADAYILATGGTSHPDTGSTGEGLQWLATIGHTVCPPTPALVPVVMKDTWVKQLSGTSVFAEVTFVSNANQEKVVGKGDILFTHFGLSGPTILNKASAVQKLLQSGEVTATIDLFPGSDTAKLQQWWHEQLQQQQNKVVKNALRHIVPAGMAKGIARLLPEELLCTKVHSVRREQRRELLELLRALPGTVTATKGEDWSIVADGGVDLREVDTATMRSHLYTNLYLTGDMLHINRPSGGYSLQLCWTTGYVAGLHA